MKDHLQPLFLFVLFAAVLGLTTACGHRGSMGTDYWQRIDSAKGLYLRGPKAQQHLEQDLSTCVHTIVELAKLSGVREEIPDFFNPVSDVEQANVSEQLKALPRWDQPEYIQDLRVDHTNYHDFEGCMRYKGWRRVQYVHPDETRRANDIYKRTKKESVREPIKKSRSGRQPLFSKLDDGSSRKGAGDSGSDDLQRKDR